MALTTDPADPRLSHGSDPADAPPHKQAEVYLVMSEEERAKGFVRPVRTSYIHEVCGGLTTMPRAIAETYAADPAYYGSTYCAHCGRHRPVGVEGEFYWDEPSRPKVGS